MFHIKILPITDLANDRFFKVANPKSPIFTQPVVPVIKILSHLRSLCIIGGVRECKKLNPFTICRHQDFSTLGLIFLKRRKYVFNVPDVINSVTSTIYFRLVNDTSQ